MLTPKPKGSWRAVVIPVLSEFCLWLGPLCAGAFWAFDGARRLGGIPACEVLFGTLAVVGVFSMLAMRFVVELTFKTMKMHLENLPASKLQVELVPPPGFVPTSFGRRPDEGTH